MFNFGETGEKRILTKAVFREEIAGMLIHKTYKPLVLL